MQPIVPNAKLAAVEKPPMAFMSCRPPTPPTTPHAGHSPQPASNSLHSKMIETVVRPTNRLADKPVPSHPVPLITADSHPPKVLVYPEEYLNANAMHLSPGGNKSILSVQKPIYIGAHLPVNKEPLPAKPVFVPVANVRCAPHVTKSPPEALQPKPIYVTTRCLTPGAGMKAGVASSPPGHDLLPIAGAVASPPPRGPHFVSQQPIVAGASSSRILETVARAPSASPRPFAPYDSALVSCWLRFKNK